LLGAQKRQSNQGAFAMRDVSQKMGIREGMRAFFGNGFRTGHRRLDFSKQFCYHFNAAKRSISHFLELLRIE
jgi:hypothetical protein